MFSKSPRVLLEDTDSVWKRRDGRMGWVGLQTSDLDNPSVVVQADQSDLLLQVFPGTSSSCGAKVDSRDELTS